MDFKEFKSKHVKWQHFRTWVLLAPAGTAREGISARRTFPGFPGVYKPGFNSILLINYLREEVEKEMIKRK